MDTMIISQSENIIKMICGKQQATIYQGPSYINVTCENASHKAWRGMGKVFTSWEDAKAAYKSASMRNMISLAQETLAN